MISVLKKHGKLVDQQPGKMKLHKLSAIGPVAAEANKQNFLYENITKMIINARKTLSLVT